MDTLKTNSENVENIEKAVKNQDNNKENKVKYLLIGLILLLVSIGLFLCLYKTTEVPEYNDIVSYDLGVNLEETYFTMSVYKKFGKKLPHSSSGQRKVGKKVSGGIKKAKAGDIICYSGHVAIYMGKNKIVHASNSAKYPKGGIKISNNASYKKILAIRRLV